MNQKPDYGAAIVVFTILKFISWIVIVLGGAVLLWGLVSPTMSSARMMMLGPQLVLLGSAVAFIGLLSLAGVQFARATVDNALISWEILDLMRKDRG